MGTNPHSLGQAFQEGLSIALENLESTAIKHTSTACKIIAKHVPVLQSVVILFSKAISVYKKIFHISVF